MTISAAIDPWASSDHDPISITEPITTAATVTVVAVRTYTRAAYAITGDVTEHS
jgi:hypothetical protein